MPSIRDYLIIVKKKFEIIYFTDTELSEKQIKRQKNTEKKPSHRIPSSRVSPPARAGDLSSLIFDIFISNISSMLSFTLRYRGHGSNENLTTDEAADRHAVVHTDTHRERIIMN